MYHNGRIEDQIEQYAAFFETNWNLLVQALIEVGSEPDNQTLRARIRSLTMILQLTAVTIDYLDNQRQKTMRDKPTFLGEIRTIYANA